MAISSDDILHIARLAKLRLTDEEVSMFAHQLTDIVAYMDILNEVDTSSVEPTSQVTGLTRVTREDEERRYSDKTSLLECSGLPKERGQIRVPSVFGDGQNPSTF